MFENCPVGDVARWWVVPPPVTAGQYVVLTAEVDSVVVFSACPMDIFPTNGPDCIPKPVAFQVHQGESPCCCFVTRIAFSPSIHTGGS
jgi:uncharacterized protein YcgI (DUF1989 family)